MWLCKKAHKKPHWKGYFIFIEWRIRCILWKIVQPFKMLNKKYNKEHKEHKEYLEKERIEFQEFLDKL